MRLSIIETNRNIQNLSITALEAVNQFLQRGKVWVAGSSPAMERRESGFGVITRIERRTPFAGSSYSPHNPLS
jgi:hypothetical protein